MFNWKSVVKSVAPTIATALGGPMVGLGVKALSQVLLGKDDGKESEIAQALQGATPETLLKLKEADQQFDIRLKELDIDLEKVNAEDRDSARKRQIAVKDKTPAVLAYLLTLGFFCVLAALFNFTIPEANKAIIFSLTGSLGTVWIAAMAYYHGSSRSSARKDELKIQ